MCQPDSVALLTTWKFKNSSYLKMLLCVCGFGWVALNCCPQTSGLARTEVQEPIPTVHAHVKSLLASRHWPKQSCGPTQSQGCMEVEGGKG